MANICLECGRPQTEKCMECGRPTCKECDHVVGESGPEKYCCDECSIAPEYRGQIPPTAAEVAQRIAEEIERGGELLEELNLTEEEEAKLDQKIQEMIEKGEIQLPDEEEGNEEKDEQ